MASDSVILQSSRSESRLCVLVPVSLIRKVLECGGEDCVASGVKLPRFRLGLGLCDLEKVICPFCTSAFPFVNEKSIICLIGLLHKMLRKHTANATYNY